MNTLNQTPILRKLKISERIVIIKGTFMTYLPMVMLSVLFIFSVWLVRNVSQKQNYSNQLPLTHITDYDFHNFNLKRYELNGKLKSSLQGLFAQHYIDSKNTEVSSPNVLIYTKDTITSVKAKKAIVNEDGSQVQLTGQILLKREDQKGETVDMQITGEFLHFFTRTDSLESHLPVKIIKGKNLFYADKLMADNINQLFDLKGNVHATLEVK